MMAWIIKEQRRIGPRQYETRYVSCVGLGPVRMSARQAHVFDDQQEAREVMASLQGHGDSLHELVELKQGTSSTRVTTTIHVRDLRQLLEMVADLKVEVGRA